MTTVSGTKIILQGTSAPSVIADSISIVNEATTARTLTNADQGKLVRSTSTSATTFTIATDATGNFKDGALIVAEQAGAGNLQIAAASGVTINSINSATKILGRYGTAILTRVAANQWNLSGDISI